MILSKKTNQKTALMVVVFSLISTVSAQEYVKSDFQVSDPSPYYYQEVRMSVSDTGQMFITWGVAGRGQIQYKTVSSEGMLISAQDTVDSPSDNYPGHMVHNGLGNCMVLFHGYVGDYDWSVMAQTFDASGSEFSTSQSLDLMTEEQINIATTSLNSNRQNLFGVMLPGADSTIAVRLSETGELLPGELIFKPEGAIFPFSMAGIMTHEGAHILVWVSLSDGNIWGQKYDENGTETGSSFQISNKIGDQSLMYPSLYTDTTGRFAVLWWGTRNDDLAVYSQLFDKDGEKIGSNALIIDGHLPNNTIHLTADMDEEGKLIVAWQSTENDSLFIYLQQVDALGVPEGGKYRATTINNDMAPGGISLPSQSSPSVKLIRDTIYLAWSNFNPELSDASTVYANIRKWKVIDHTGTDKPELGRGDLVLYPNPTEGQLALKFPAEVSGAVSIQIYSSQGALVSQQIIHVTGNEIPISLPELAEGPYYLEARTVTFHGSESFIIHK